MLFRVDLEVGIDESSKNGDEVDKIVLGEIE